MAVIHLQFDVDSDVHPELHAMLASIVNASVRGERLRQLAATGLVWERVRIEDHAGPLRGSAFQVKADVSSSPVNAPAGRVAPKARKPAKSRPEFVDLAMDGASGLSRAPVDPLALREFADEIESAARELPMLFDVLDPIDLLPAAAPSPKPRTAAPATKTKAPPETPRPAEAAAQAEPAADEPPTPATISPDAAPTKSPPRSRLMRMKEKGLFKNE